MKKLLSLLLTSVMAFSLVACGSSGSSDTTATNSTPATATGEAASENSESATTDTPTKLVWSLKTWGTTPTDMDMVEEAINTHLLKTYNIEVEILPIGIGDWNEKMNVMLASPSEQLDLVAMNAAQFNSYTTKGQLQPLDDLLDTYGKDIQTALGDYIVGGIVNGDTYAVTTIREMANGTGFIITQEAVDKIGADLSTVKALEDYEPILASLKEAYPDMYPLALMKSLPSVRYSMSYDPLGDEFGVLMDYENGTTVTNLFATEEYANYCKLMRKWYLAGYISPDAATNENANNAQVKAGTALTYFSKTKPGIELENKNTLGEDVLSVEYRKPIATSASIQSAMWGIANNSTHPQEAMILLNALYSDPILINLINYGIEGVHYEVKEDGTAGFLEGITAETSTYNLSMQWQMGNQYLTYVAEGNEPDLVDQLKKFNDEATASAAMGFVFDQNNVATEVSALTSVVEQYANALETGSVDVDTVLPEFLSKLEAAGISNVISDKQAQLDAWVATSK